MTTTSPCLEATSPSDTVTSLFSLTGKHVLISGATRGIGAACARALAQAGASCCLIVRPGHRQGSGPHPALHRLPQGVHDTQKHTIVEADLGDMAQVKAVFDKALGSMDGQIDVLVNCGGIQRRHPTVDFPEEDWDEVGENEVCRARIPTSAP